MMTTRGAEDAACRLQNNDTPPSMTCDQHRPPPPPPLLRRPNHCHLQSSSGACMQGIEQRRRSTRPTCIPSSAAGVIHLTYPPEEAIGAVGPLAPSVAAADRGFTPDRSIARSLTRSIDILTYSLTARSIHRSRKTQQQRRHGGINGSYCWAGGGQRSVKPSQHVCSGNLKPPSVLCMHLSRHGDDAE